MKKINNVYTFNTSSLGQINVSLYKKQRIGNCFYVEGKYKKEIISALINKKGEEIVPFAFRVLETYFKTKDNKNICLAFRYKDEPELLEYYHVQYKEKLDDYKLILNTSIEDEVPLFMLPIEDNDRYWVFEAIKEIPEYAAYDIEKGKIITNFFHELRILPDDDNPYHTIYYAKNIYNTEEEYDYHGNRTLLTKVCGFLDADGNFSSQIYDEAVDELYNSYYCGGNTLSREFVSLLADLEKHYREEKEYADAYANEIVSYLYSYSNMSDKPETYKTKILEFKNDGKKK